MPINRGFWNHLPKPIVGLSPMDGVTDAPFRLITAKYGRPTVIFTEFTNVEALAHGAIKALTAFLYDQTERPIVAQIYGISPEAFYKACFVVAELGFDGIDINMGCPSKSVSGNGGGAGLIRTPMLAQEIIQSCQKAAQEWADGKTIYEAGVHRDIIDYIEQTQAGTPPNTENSPARPHQNKKFHTSLTRPPFQPTRRLLPISVKTRIGYDKPVTESWIKNLLECSPANISLHGRTLNQMYSGQADWNQIALAARLTHQSGTGCTLLGNGDVKSHDDALKKIAEFGVDGVLIGRATFGNPWVFQPDSLENPGTYKFNHSAPIDEQTRIAIAARLDIAIEHAHLNEKFFGEDPKAFAPMKKHLGWYATDFPHSKDLRLLMMKCNSADEVEILVKQAKNDLHLN